MTTKEREPGEKPSGETRLLLENGRIKELFPRLNEGDACKTINDLIMAGEAARLLNLGLLEDLLDLLKFNPGTWQSKRLQIVLATLMDHYPLLPSIIDYLSRKNPDIDYPVCEIAELYGYTINSELVEKNDDSTILKFIELAKQENATVRRLAVEVLGELNDTEEYPKSMEVFCDYLRNSQLIPTLLRALEDEWGPVRDSSAGSLSGFAELGFSDILLEWGALPILIQALGDEDAASFSSMTLLFLADTDPSAVVQSLVEVLKDENVTRRGQAAGTLGGITGITRPGEGKLILKAGALPLLMEMLHDNPFPVNCALHCLTKMVRSGLGEAVAGEGAVKKLLPLLRHPDNKVRQSAITSLQVLASDEQGRDVILPELIKALEDGDLWVRREAMGALVGLEGPPGAKIVKKRLRRETNPEERKKLENYLEMDVANWKLNNERKRKQ